MPILKELFEWTQNTFEPLGSLGLFILAFIESSFFPIPPDILLVVLALGDTSNAFWFASVATLGSVLGGIFGYGIGFFFGEVVLRKFVKEEKLMKVHDFFNKYEAQAILVAAISPFPYKIVTISAGLFYISFCRWEKLFSVNAHIHPCHSVVSRHFSQSRFYISVYFVLQNIKYGPYIFTNFHTSRITCW